MHTILSRDGFIWKRWDGCNYSYRSIFVIVAARRCLLLYFQNSAARHRVNDTQGRVLRDPRRLLMSPRWHPGVVPREGSQVGPAFGLPPPCTTDGKTFRVVLCELCCSVLSCSMQGGGSEHGGPTFMLQVLSSGFSSGTRSRPSPVILIGHGWIRRVSPGWLSPDMKGVAIKVERTHYEPVTFWKK